MKKLLFLILFVIVAAWLGTLIAKDPGYAFFAYQHWTVEMPLWLAFTLIIVFLFILFIVSSILQGTGNLFTRTGGWFKRRKYKQSIKKTSQGLALLAEGKWAKAEAALTQAAKHNQQPLANYLAAAKAAQAQGANERRDEYLHMAAKTTPDAAIAVGLTQAELQLKHEQLEHALATLRHLHGAAPKHRHVLEMLANLYRDLEDWHELYSLLPQLKKHKVFTSEQIEVLELDIFKSKLSQCALSKAALSELWHQIPKGLRKQSDILLPYVNALIKLNRYEEAEVQLKQALKSTWQPALIDAYGQLKSDKPDRQLQLAETWLKQHDQSATLLLALGRLAIANQLWGKAGSYLEQSLALEKTPAAYYAYGELLLILNDESKARTQFQQGLKQSIVT